MPVLSLENTPLLNLITEKKLSALLGEFAPSRLEASGVCMQDGIAMVVFDNLSQMARIDASLEPEKPGNALIGLPANEAGYEGLTWDQSERKFFVVVEAVKRRKGIRGQIHVFDERLVLLESHWLGYPLKAKNKGFEGIVHMRRNGEEYLLGLCEGNKCRGASAGKIPGNGRIQVYRKASDAWVHENTLKLPKAAAFIDYSGLAVRGDRLAVVSQESSALWVGTLAADEWGCNDDGQVYRFPRKNKDKVVYCNIEGVDWFSDDRIIVVSDKTKSDQKKRCRDQDQSIHLFSLP